MMCCQFPDRDALAIANEAMRERNARLVEALKFVVAWGQPGADHIEQARAALEAEEKA